MERRTCLQKKGLELCSASLSPCSLVGYFHLRIMVTVDLMFERFICMSSVGTPGTIPWSRHKAAYLGTEPFILVQSRSMTPKPCENDARTKRRCAQLKHSLPAFAAADVGDAYDCSWLLSFMVEFLVDEFSPVKGSSPATRAILGSSNSYRKGLRIRERRAKVS